MITSFHIPHDSFNSINYFNLGHDNFHIFSNSFNAKQLTTSLHQQKVGVITVVVMAVAVAVEVVVVVVLAVGISSYW
jgi:uncharacterized membrane-anchored protein